MVWKLTCISTLLVACCLSGCGPSGPVMVPVSGTVTLDGEPMEDGVVYFKRPEVGAVDRMEVKDGKFAGIAEVGDRRVEVCRYRFGEPFRMGNAEIPNRIETIDAKFNTNSELTANVTEDGSNEFQFEVTLKKAE